MATQNELKQAAAKVAADMVEDGMVVGLGTGSTVKFFVDFLGERVQKEGLSITGVTTSNRTNDQASALGIPLKDVDEVDQVDLTIDGADEVDPQLNGIKGGGAAHLWEKIVAVNSAKNIWIVDASKLSDQLGSFPLPVEVIPYGSGQLIKKLAAKGLNPILRLDDAGQPVLSDSKNYVVDLKLGKIDNPAELADYLSNLTGVVEHGLFLNIASQVIVGQEGQPKILTR